MSPVTLRGMTYNLKFPRDERPHAWPDRRPLVAEVLRQVRPQLIGTQEGHFGQLRDIVSDSSYAWIGQGRKGGSRGEYAAVLYDPEVLEPRQYDFFWLSATPDRVGSTTRWWGNHVVRMATWVRFRLLGSDTELIWLNTHLDNSSERARRRGARLIARRLAAFDRDLPTVLSGDFNCPAGRSAAFSILTRDAGLRDAWELGGGPDVGTYGGWKAPEPGGGRIDWLLVRGPVQVQAAGICDYHDGDEWPSDHVPTWADLSVG